MASIIEIKLLEFVNTWGAHVQPNGDPYTRDQVAELDHHYVWTITDSDDVYPGFIALPGFHIDDRYGHCVTKVAWTEEFYRAGSYAIWKQP